MSSINFLNNFSSSFYCLFNQLFQFIYLLILLNLIPNGSLAVKCLDCVGRDCMGSTCTGDYCMISRYAPRWGTMVWGEPVIVKGCLSGKMIRNDLRSHCEITEDESKDEELSSDKPFTCFCNSKDYCNKIIVAEKLKTEKIPLYTCVCKGDHCKGSKCVGELCTYVVNRQTDVTEQGCVNSTVPLFERRSAGACTMPPITGAMHRTVAKVPDDLLFTESCACEGNYCNKKKPKIKVEEKSKCKALVHVEVMGHNMTSKENATCTGEFCVKVEIRSEIGHMKNYRTMGCASFADTSQLPEELNPTGCAQFSSENLDVLACFSTKDKEAIARHKSRSKGKKKIKSRPKSSEEKNSEEEEEEENEEVMKEDDWDKEEEEENGRKEDKEEENKEKTQHYIIEKPTFGPELNESTNSTLISVFILLILLILLSGVVWKFQLHKKLFRASYDTVAGGT